MDLREIENEIMDAIVRSAEQYISERMKSPQDRKRLQWAFGRASIAAGGSMLGRLVGDTTPAVDCIEEFARLARKNRRET